MNMRAALAGACLAAMMAVTPAMAEVNRENNCGEQTSLGEREKMGQARFLISNGEYQAVTVESPAIEKFAEATVEFFGPRPSDAAAIYIEGVSLDGKVTSTMEGTDAKTQAKLPSNTAYVYKADGCPFGSGTQLIWPQEAVQAGMNAVLGTKHEPEPKGQPI